MTASSYPLVSRIPTIVMMVACVLLGACDRQSENAGISKPTASSASDSSRSTDVHSSEAPRGDTSESSAVTHANLAQVTMGIQTSPAMALVMVAQDKGYFREAGVEVEIKEFTAGKFALQAFLGGSLDFCVSGEVPVALATMQGNKITVVSQVVRETIDEVRVVALKDANGSVDAKAYFKKQKRRLATSFGGGPEFFTYSFLKHLGIQADEVELISQTPQDMPAALKARSVDAVAIFDPFAYFAERLVGDEGVTYKASDVYSELYVLSATREQLDDRPQNVRAVIRGLIQAGDFIRTNPDEAKAIVARYTKLEPDVVDGVWASFNFDAALTKNLLLVWERQAEWAKETNKVPPTTPIPDFRRVLEVKFLMELRPEAVTLE